MDVEYYHPSDPDHQLVYEPGVVSCTCGDWWLKEEDVCAEHNPHYGLWDAWRMGRLMEATDPESNLELMDALENRFGPALPSVWDQA